MDGWTKAIACITSHAIVVGNSKISVGYIKLVYVSIVCAVFKLSTHFPSLWSILSTSSGIGVTDMPSQPWSHHTDRLNADISYLNSRVFIRV